MSNFIERLQHYMAENGINDNQMTVTAGLSVGLLGKAKTAGKGMSSLNIEKILLAYPDLSPDWLLTGRGEMLKTATNEQPTPKDQEKAIPFVSASQQNLKPIPLVTQTVAAGFGNENFAIADSDVKDFYVIPKFRYCNIDFMIEVTGDSMAPHLNSGDVIACSIIKDSHFLQWNRIHVIATREQGLLVKRLSPSESDNCLQAVSDNPKYPPFSIPKDEITGLALVVGSVCLE